MPFLPVTKMDPHTAGLDDPESTRERAGFQDGQEIVQTLHEGAKVDARP